MLKSLAHTDDINLCMLHVRAVTPACNIPHYLLTFAS